jgi:hypothetical protein
VTAAVNKYALLFICLLKNSFTLGIIAKFTLSVQFLVFNLTAHDAVVNSLLHLKCAVFQRDY